LGVHLQCLVTPLIHSFAKLAHLRFELLIVDLRLFSQGSAGHILSRVALSLLLLLGRTTDCFNSLVTWG